MKSITLYNKSKRIWTLKNAAGADEQVKPETSIEMEEADGLRMLVDYPREFTSSKIAGPSSEDLARREQSLKDRAANLDAREKALDEREAALKIKESAFPADDTGSDMKSKRGPGRPPKAEGTAPEIK